MKLKFIISFLLISLVGYSQISESNKLKNEAIELLMNKEYSNSLIKINKAISLNQVNADYYYIRGNAYEKLMQVEKAKADYLKAIQLIKYLNADWEWEN
jgi:Flp pilus assembly protein TadD